MYQRCFDNAIETLFEQGKRRDFPDSSLAMILTGSPDIMFMIMKRSLSMLKRGLQD